MFPTLRTLLVRRAEGMLLAKLEFSIVAAVKTKGAVIIDTFSDGTSKLQELYMTGAPGRVL